jgi:hypothetical protein
MFLFLGGGRASRLRQKSELQRAVMQEAIVTWTALSWLEKIKEATDKNTPGS